jgi:hypothetical protein
MWSQALNNLHAACSARPERARVERQKAYPVLLSQTLGPCTEQIWRDSLERRCCDRQLRDWFSRIRLPHPKLGIGLPGFGECLSSMIWLTCMNGHCHATTFFTLFYLSSSLRSFYAIDYSRLYEWRFFGNTIRTSEPVNRLHLTAKSDENGEAGFEFQNLILFGETVFAQSCWMASHWMGWLSSETWTLSHISPLLANLEPA